MSKFLSVSLIVDSDPRLHTQPVAEIVKHKVRLFVECPHGTHTLEEIDEIDGPAIVLEIQTNKHNPALKHFILEGENRHTCAQGAFAWTCDSRFSDTYGRDPVAIYMNENQELFE